jgi:two-component system cell cycle sensor histidine kinase/response regulator CckA
MGPYQFTNAVLVGFFGFGAIYHLILWSRARRERAILAFALLCMVSAANSYAVMMVVSATTVEAAQRALDLRAASATCSIIALTWLFALFSGVGARWLVYGVTAVLGLLVVRAALGAHLTGVVIGLRQVTTPWGETLTFLERAPTMPLLTGAYAVALAIPAFGVWCAWRLWASDRVGSVLLATAAAGLFVSGAVAMSVDVFRETVPYLGPFVAALWILPSAWQVARLYRVRDEQLLAATQRFRAIFDQTFQYIGLLDVDGTVLEANQSALAFLNLVPGDVIGRKFWETPWWDHSPKAQARVRDAVAAAARGEVVRFETTHPGIDGLGRHIDFSLKPVRDANGAIVLLIPEGHDITPRKQAEDALRRSEERFRFLIQNQTEFVASAAADGTQTFVNESFSRYFGVGADAAVGTRLFDRFTPEARRGLAAALAALTAERPVASGDWQAVNASGEPRWTQWTISGTFDAGQRLVGLQTTGRDIHDRVAAEEAKARLELQLLQAQKLEALGQLAGGVAHDFNNLLTVIAGHAEMLLMNATDPAMRQDLSQIQLASERAASMTRQLLAFSRQSVLEPRVTSLNAVVTDTEALLRRTIGAAIELVVRTAPDLHPITADPDQLGRVLVNTAINARDAMPDGGRLEIVTRNVVLDDARAAAGGGRGGHYVLLSVSDTGTGMSPEVRARLFEPFFTTKDQGKGTGLGLAVVDGIIKQSGGWVDVDSALGAGTTFRIYLPAAGANPKPQPAADRGRYEQARGHETVLLVEDQAEVREMTRAALERHGYTVLAAGGGAEALDVLRRRDSPIDVVLTDVVMPGMSGPQLIERLREDGEIPAVFMSGYTSDALPRHGLDSDDTGFIQKPFTAATLVAKLRQVLDRR